MYSKCIWHTNFGIESCTGNGMYGIPILASIAALAMVCIANAYGISILICIAAIAIVCMAYTSKKGYSAYQNDYVIHTISGVAVHT